MHPEMCKRKRKIFILNGNVRRCIKPTRCKTPNCSDSVFAKQVADLLRRLPRNGNYAELYAVCAAVGGKLFKRKKKEPAPAEPQPENDDMFQTRGKMMQYITVCLGGRVAEDLVFHSITTGASNDIEQATKLARAMITRYGMSDDFDMVALETVTNQYLGGDASLACSADTQKVIDDKVVALVKTQHEKAKKILTENRSKLDVLAQYLYEKETITGEEFMTILEREGAKA